MSTTRVLSQSDAGLLIDPSGQTEPRLAFLTVHPDERSEVEALLGTLLTFEGDTAELPLASSQIPLRDRLAARSNSDLVFTDVYSFSVDNDEAMERYLAHASTSTPVENGPGIAGLLVEGYQHYASDAVLFVPVRVVENFENDVLVLNQAYSEFQSDHVRADPAQPHTLYLRGLLPHIIESSTHPLGRRMKSMVESFYDLARRIGLAELQKVLTDLGLGTINGLDLDALASLTGDQFALVLGGLRAAYTSSVTSGALYYLVEKGTLKETFRAWYNQTCAQYGWNPEHMDFAFFVIHHAGLETSSDIVRAATSDTGQFYLDHVHLIEDRDEKRHAALYAGSEAVAQAAARITARPVAQLVADPDAPGVEVSSALRRAFQDGESASDPQLGHLMANLDQGLRISLIRTSGEEQNWFFQLLQNAVEVTKAARQSA